MDSRSNLMGAVGVLLMASAVALPWAKTGPAGQAVDSVAGFEHGFGVVLILAAIGAAGLALGNRPVTSLAASIAALWTVLVMYQLPGSLTDTGGVGIAEMSWGSYLALAGSILLAIAPWSRPRRASVLI